MTRQKMDETLDSFSTMLEELLLVDNGANWTYLVIAIVTIIVLFYGTRYVFTGVDGTGSTNDSIPYKRCNVGPRAAVVSMKGHRQYMEDTYQAVPSFGGRDNWSFYGVFDGHGGARCSVYVAHFLYKHVWSCIDLYLEHNSLNSNKLWKKLLNDENLITMTLNETNNSENAKNDNSNQNNKTNNKNNNNNDENKGTNSNSNIETNDKNIASGNRNNKNEKNESRNSNNTSKIENEIETETENEKESEIEKEDSNDNSNESNSKNEKKKDLIVNGNENENENENSMLTKEAIKQMEEMDKVPSLNESNVNTRTEYDRNDKNKSFSVMSQRGSDVGDLNESNSKLKNKFGNNESNTSKEVKKLIGIPKYVNDIMKEALIQSHRYADKEFLAMANRQQWQDGSTAISCVILPAKDILRALMNEERNGFIKNEGNKNASGYHITNICDNTGYNSHENGNHGNHDKMESCNLNIDDICDDKDTWMFVANTGDSRAVLVGKNGESTPLSTDHKPNRLDERRRIEEKGGRVVFFGVWRVEGVLAVSRAFGDRRLKRWVVPDPEITSRKVNENDLFLILASDGVWDALSNEQAARYACEVWNDAIYANADLKTRLQAIAGKISSMAFRQGSMDNITALVVHIPTHCTSYVVSNQDNVDSSGNASHITKPTN